MAEYGIDDRDLTQVVQHTTRRLHRNALITGAAIVELATVGWLLAAIVIDLVLPMPVWLRVTMWTGLWLMLTASLAVGLVWPLLRRPTDQQVALRIERAMGGMHNRLLTVLDLRANGHGREEKRRYDDRSRIGEDGDNRNARSANRGLVQRLIEQTRQRLSGYRVEQVADPRRMRRSLAGVGGTLVVLAVLGLFFSDRMPTAVARVMMPTANIPPATYLQLDPPGDLEVLHGEGLTIPGAIARGSADEVTLHYRSEGGRWVRYPMSRDEQGEFSFTLSSVTEDAEYFISAGRTWTPTHRVNVVPRPVVENVSTIAHPPAYLGRDSRLEPRDHVIQAVAGSTIEVRADASGEATRGELVLLKAETTTQTQQVEEESVWFDDELPDDAEPSGRWRWSTSRAYSGVRSHTFGWDRKSYGFRTRLNPLRVADEGAFFVYVWLDDAQPPNAITLKLAAEERSARLTWGDPDGEPADDAIGDADAAGVHVGDLPPTGEWARLEVSRDELADAMAEGGGEDAEARSEALRLTGIAFAVDTGRVHFDRAGALVRRSETRQQTRYEQVDTRALTEDVETGRWTGRFELTEDRHFTVRLFNALDQASASVRPIHAIAVEDANPRVVVERPGRDVTLTEPQSLTVTVRAADDHGLESIGVQYGSSAEELGPVQTLNEYDEPRRRRSLESMIAADRLRKGAALHYRFVATDRKGQSGYSETYRVAVLGEDHEPGEDDEPALEPPDLLDDVIEALADLMHKPLDLAEALAELADLLPEDMSDRLPDTDGEQWLHDDGTPMSDDEVRALFEELYAELEEDQQAKLQEFDQMLKDRQEQMRELAEQLREAAEQAEQSPLSLPGEAESLEMARERMEQMADQARQETASEGEAEALEQFARADARQAGAQAGAQAQQMEQLGDDLAQLDSAREMARDDPEAAREQAEATRARMQAQRATYSLAALDRTLGQLRQELDALSTEQARLQSQTPDASAEQLDQIAEQQADLDERASEPIEETHRVLGEDDDAPADEADPDSAADEVAIDAEPDEPAAAAEERSADESAAQREQLDARQQQMQQQLDTSGAAAGDVQQEAQDAADEVASGLTQLDMAQRELAAAHEAESDGEDEELLVGDDDADLDSATRREQAAERLRVTADQLEQLLGRSRVQELMAMSQRAMGHDEMEAEGEGSQQLAGEQEAGQDAGFMSEEEVNLMLMEQAMLPPGERESAGYRLPPQARQALLQGMQEQGPEGYQSLIDAYYRELSREVK